MRVSGIIALLACLGLAACDVTGARSVVVPGPDGGTIIVAAMTDEGPVFVSVWHEAPLAQRASAELAEVADFRIYRLEYPGTPADWDLSEGDLPLREDGPRRLDTPESIQRAHVSRSGQGPWATLDELPEELARLRLNLPERTRCLDLEWEDVPLPVDGEFWAAVPVDDARVLIVVERPDESQTFFIYSADGLEPVSLPGTRVPARIRGGARDARGKIWLATKREGVWYGDLETGFTQTSTLALLRDRIKLATPTDPESDDGLYVWTGKRVLHRFGYDGRAERLGDMQDDDSDFWFGLEWLAPGEVLAVSGDLPEYLHVKDGETHRRTAPGKLHSIVRDARGQVYAGSLLGAMWSWTGSDWQDFTRLGNGRILNIFELPTGVGLLAGGGNGEFLQYIFETQATCIEQLGTSDIGALIPFEGGAVLWPNYPGHNDAQRLSVVRFPESR